MKTEIHSGRLPSLDGLRAISIAMVVMGHSSATARQLNPSASTVLSWLGEGGLGVSIFFVISGFLITTLLTREERHTQSIDLKKFYLRRAFRIFPAFYVYWLLILALTVLGYVHVSHMDLFSSAVYVWNYVHRTVDTWFLGHTWSLSVEEQFYLLWPFVLKLAKAERAKWIALGVVVFAPFIRLASYFWLPSTRPLIGMMLPTRADSLMVGALLALFAQNAAHCAILKRKTKSTLIPLVALCFFAIDTILSRRFKGIYILPVGYTLQNLMIAALVTHVVFHDTTRLGKILNHRILIHVGTISYSLYLWQQLFLTPMNTTFMGRFPLNLLCALIAAELSYYIIEKPFLRMRKRFSNSHSGVSAAAVSTRANARQIAASASA